MAAEVDITCPIERDAIAVIRPRAAQVTEQERLEPASTIDSYPFRLYTCQRRGREHSA